MRNNILLKNISYVALATAGILLIPLVGMQVSEEVQWNLFDFIVMGTLIFGTGLAYVLATRKVGDGKRRAFIGLALGVVLFLIWAELAVGIFGTPFAGS